MAQNKKNRVSQKMAIRQRITLVAVALIVVIAGLVALQMSRAATAPVTVNDNTIGTGTNQWQYTGLNWRLYTDGGNKFQGDDHSTSTAGDYAVLTFKGVQAAYYGSKASHAGIVAVSVDGGAETMIDLYSQTRMDNTLLYTTPLVSNGDHTLKIRNTGQKNAASTGTAAAVDRAVVTVDIGDGKTMPLESEDGTVANPASAVSDTTASNGRAVTFKAASTGNPGRTLRYMPLGDSITDGYGVPGSYRTVLWQKLVSQDKLAIDFVGSMSTGPSSLGDKDNEGHSGWCIEAKCWGGTAGSNTIYQKITGWQSTYKPDIISIHIGTNDIGNDYDGISKGTTGAMVATRLDNLIARIYQNNPSASLVVCQIINMNSSYSYDRQMYDQYVSAIPGIVTKYKNQGRKIQLADMRSLLTYPGDYRDGWHPNQSGYDKMGNFLYPLVKNAYSMF